MPDINVRVLYWLLALALIVRWAWLQVKTGKQFFPASPVTWNTAKQSVFIQSLVWGLIALPIYIALFAGFTIGRSVQPFSWIIDILSALFILGISLYFAYKYDLTNPPMNNRKWFGIVFLSLGCIMAWFIAVDLFALPFILILKGILLLVGQLGNAIDGNITVQWHFAIAAIIYVIGVISLRKKFTWGFSAFTWDALLSNIFVVSILYWLFYVAVTHYLVDWEVYSTAQNWAKWLRKEVESW